MDGFSGTKCGTGLQKKWWGDKEPSDKSSIWYKGGCPFVYDASTKSWVPQSTSGGGSESGSGSGNFIKSYVDAYMKQYTDEAIDDNVIVATKYFNKVGVYTPPVNNYDINANVLFIKKASGEYYLPSVSDYSDTLQYLNEIKHESISIDKIYSGWGNYISSSDACITSPDTVTSNASIIYVPNYGILSNTQALLTAQTEGYSDAIVLFPYIKIKYNSRIYALPLFVFDKFNQSLGGTAIDWSKVFPENGVKYKDL